jgi:hypothetical protein
LFINPEIKNVVSEPRNCVYKNEEENAGDDTNRCIRGGNKETRKKRIGRKRKYT